MWKRIWDAGGEARRLPQVKKKPESMKVPARQVILGQQLSSGLTTSNHRISI